MLDKIISSKRSTVLLFIALGFVCYGWILDTPFKLMDDFACIVDNTAIHTLANWKHLFTDSFFGGDGAYYRPLVNLSFLLEYHFFKLDYLFYNLDNLLLHIGNAWLLLALLMRLLKDRASAFWVSLLFLIHPVHWEQITNIPGRSILLCAFFILAAMLLLVKSLDDNSRSLQRAVYYIGSLIAFAGGLLSKESAGVFPLIAASLMMFYVKADARRKIVLTLGYFALLGAYLWVRGALGITQIGASQTPEAVSLAVLTFLKSLWIHAATLLLPANLVYDRSLELFKDFTGIQLWVVAGSWLLVVGAIIANRRRLQGLDWFWLSWIVLNFLPVSQLVIIPVSASWISIADHFLYLPSIGLFIFLVKGVRALLRQPAAAAVSPRLQQTLLTMWIIFLILSTMIQTVIASNQLAMFETALANNPNNDRVRLALGSAYGYAGFPVKAEENFRRILKYDPFNAKAGIGLGKALCDQDRCLEAIAQYHNVVNPGEADVQLLRDNLDKTYRYVITDYEARLKKDPDNVEFQDILKAVHAMQDADQGFLRRE